MEALSVSAACRHSQDNLSYEMESAGRGQRCSSIVLPICMACCDKGRQSLGSPAA